MTSLHGSRILLTGASSGIGRALAHQLAAEGATLAVAARRLPLLEELSASIEASGHPAPVVLHADLSIPGSAAELADRATEALGGVDILISNAGTSVTGAITALGDSDAARAVFETNVWSPIALATALTPDMRARGFGTIVNVTSTIQAVPMPLLGYYAASKSALAQATKSLRHELSGTGVRVLEVVPGGIDTDLRDVDSLPWRGGAPRLIPPSSTESMARAIVKALTGTGDRLVYPPYPLLPLELPVVGRFIARAARQRIDVNGD